VSEKIFDAFKAKTIPIYWGADNVTDYIPKDCFVDKRDFETYDELYLYLKNMTEKEYNRRIKAIEEYLKSDQYKSLFSSEGSAQIVFNALNKKRDDFSYKKAYKMLKQLQKKKDKVDKYKSCLVYSSLDPANYKKVYMKCFYVAFKDDNIDFVVHHENNILPILNFEKKNINSGEILEYSFDVVIEDMDQGDKVSISIRNNEKLQKLRIKESIESLHASIGLRITKNKLYITRGV
jgi:hypothetical protein